MQFWKLHVSTTRQLLNSKHKSIGLTHSQQYKSLNTHHPAHCAHLKKHWPKHPGHRSVSLMLQLCKLSQKNKEDAGEDINTDESQAQILHILPLWSLHLLNLPVCTDEPRLSPSRDRPTWIVLYNTINVMFSFFSFSVYSRFKKEFSMRAWDMQLVWSQTFQ